MRLCTLLTTLLLAAAPVAAEHGGSDVANCRQDLCTSPNGAGGYDCITVYGEAKSCKQEGDTKYVAHTTEANWLFDVYTCCPEDPTGFIIGMIILALSITGCAIGIWCCCTKRCCNGCCYDVNTDEDCCCCGPPKGHVVGSISGRRGPNAQGSA